MFDLNEKISGWRNRLAKERPLEEKELDRLEAQLRARVAEAGHSGLSGEDAFQVALNRLANPRATALETAMTEPRWKRPLLWVLAGYLIVSCLGNIWKASIATALFVAGAPPLWSRIPESAWLTQAAYTALYALIALLPLAVFARLWRSRLQSTAERIYTWLGKAPSRKIMAVGSLSIAGSVTLAFLGLYFHSAMPMNLYAIQFAKSALPGAVVQVLALGLALSIRAHKRARPLSEKSAFDLESWVQSWKESLRGQGAFTAGDVEELESHLRDTVDELSRTGLSERESCVAASQRLGSADALAREFGKINRGEIWRRRLQWMLAGYLGATLVFSIGRSGLYSIPLLETFNIYAVAALLTVAFLGALTFRVGAIFERLAKWRQSAGTLKTVAWGLFILAGLGFLESMTAFELIAKMSKEPVPLDWSHFSGAVTRVSVQMGFLAAILWMDRAQKREKTARVS